MIRRYLLPTAAAAVSLVIAGVLVVSHTHRKSSPNMPMAMATTPQQAPRLATDTNLRKAIRVFANRYGRYLDGGAATVMGRAGTVTAVDQAREARRIPVKFRDGRLTASLGAIESTCCSASVTVLLADREESYPFAEQLLLEHHGWVVEQITPPDLSMDRELRPAPHVSPPAAGEVAAREFALAYANYRDGMSQTRPAMTAVAARQVKAGTDSLAGQATPHVAARLVSIAFGPPSGREFATTAVIHFDQSRQSFSFLSVRTPAGWKCSQFL